MSENFTIKYSMNEKETATARAFLDKHRNCSGGTIGTAIIWEITPTSIGDLCTVKCSKCKKKKFITDVSQL